MRIAVMGSGGLGGYLGGLLARAGEEVAFIARGVQLEALRARGLTVGSHLGETFGLSVAATDDPARVGPVELILFCVKAYDLETAAEQLYFDIAAGRRTELETLSGALVRLGQSRGVPTPLNFAVYAALKPYSDGPPEIAAESS